MNTPFNRRNSHIVWLIRLLKPYRQRVILSSTNVIVRSLLLLCPPFLTRIIIDQIIPQKQGILLTISSTGLVMVSVVVGALIIWDLHISRFALTVASRLRADIYNGLQHRSLDWFATEKTGNLLSRAQRDTEKTFFFVYQGLGNFLWFTVTIFAGLIMMAWLDWKLTLALVVLLYLQEYVIRKLGRKFEEASRLLAIRYSSLTEQIRESATGALFIKSVGQQDYEISRLESQLDDHFLAFKHSLTLKRLFELFNGVTTGLLPAFIYFWGGLEVIQEKLTIGSLVALIALYDWIWPSALAYRSIYLNFQETSPSIARIREILFPTKNNNGGTCVPTNFAVQFFDVSFGYHGQQCIIQNVSFSTENYRIFALVGPSGSGKSTIADLLLALRKPNTGFIHIGGVLLTEIDFHWLRRHVVSVSQDVQLRNCTLLENITYGIEVNEETLQRVLEIVSLKEWIDQLPDGLQTLVGEQGLQISGGERQRISIARAILRQPSVLILDEATSALDTITERKVMSSLCSYLPHTTFFVIAHRLSAVIHADHIIVLEKGTIVEEGKHNQLMGFSGLYAHMYKKQEIENGR